MGTRSKKIQPSTVDTTNYPTKVDITKYEMINPLLISAYEEMKVLSSKKQDGVLNNLKVKMINKLINSAREILVDEINMHYLDILDEDMLPQNSDVVLILSQYIESLNQYRRKNTVRDRFGALAWRTQGNPNP